MASTIYQRPEEVGDEDLGTTIHRMIDNQFFQVKTCLPAVIEEVDYALQQADVTLCIKAIQMSGIEGQEEVVFTLPIITALPVRFPRVKGFGITFPYKKGDSCMVHFSQRGLTLWKEFGGVQEPDQRRKFDYNDAYIELGGYSEPDAYPDYNPEDMVIRSTDNTQTIIMKLNKDIEVATTANTKVSCVNAELNATGQTTINCPTTTINGDVVLNGNLTQTGNQNVTGTITATAGMFSSGYSAVGGGTPMTVASNGVITASDAVLGSITFSGHKHQVIQVGQPTGVPQ